MLHALLHRCVDVVRCGLVCCSVVQCVSIDVFVPHAAFQGELQRHLDGALYEIEHLKVAVMHGEKEIRETTALLNLSYKKNASIEDAMQHDKGRFHQDTDERDTKIMTLQSKVAVAEMREEHLLQHVQDIGLARDSLLKNQLRTSAELYASQECVCVRGWVGGCMGVVLQGVVACCSVWQCVKYTSNIYTHCVRTWIYFRCVEALRNEKDALQRILVAKKVIETGFHIHTHMDLYVKNSNLQMILHMKKKDALQRFVVAKNVIERGTTHTHTWLGKSSIPICR